MSAREGSIWIEQGKLCYTDDNGEKKCLDFEEVKNRVTTTENKTQDNETSITSETTNNNFSFSVDGSNSPVRLPGTYKINVSVTNNGDNRTRKDIIYSFDGELREIRSDEIFDAGEERQLTFSTEIESSSEVSSLNPLIRIGTGTSGICEEATLEVPSQFNVNITNTNSPVDPGNTLDVTADIENTDSVSDTHTINLDVGGTIRDSREITLSSSTTTTETLSWTDTKSGNYTAEFSSESDSDTADITINGETDTAHFDVTIDSINEPVAPNDVVVGATIENIGDTSGTQTIDFVLDGTSRDSQSITLDAGESQSIDLIWSDTSPGLYSFTVSSEDDSVDNIVNVLKSGGPFFAVDIKTTDFTVEAGNTLEVVVDIINLGDESDTQTIAMYYLDFETPKIMDTKDVTLNSGTASSGFSSEITLTYDIPVDWSGEKTITVASDDDSESFTLTTTDDSGGSEDVNAGYIIHEQPEETLEGNYVNKDAWFEIFGEEIHFSQT